MRETGLVLGKFYPPHAGHHYLIDQAEKEMLARGGRLVVLVACSSSESLPLMTRLDALKRRHPDVWFFGTIDNHPVDYDDPAIWDLHMEVWRRALRPRVPSIDIVFSSEEYGDELARRFGATHHRVDLDRGHVPISGTAIRNDPETHWHHLGSRMREKLVKRIVVIGGESTGTTTLAEALAKNYQTVCVPEWGRMFSEAVGEGHEWTKEDFRLIAVNQARLEDDLAGRSRNGVLICDTDVYATAMFEELYLGGSNGALERMARSRAEIHTDLYIITDHRDVPFVQDGTRLFGHKREWMTNWLVNHLPHDRMMIVGPSRRQQACIEEIDSLLTWDFAPPLG